MYYYDVNYFSNIIWCIYIWIDIGYLYPKYVYIYIYIIIIITIIIIVIIIIMIIIIIIIIIIITIITIIIIVITITIIIITICHYLWMSICQPQIHFFLRRSASARHPLVLRPLTEARYGAR